MVSLSFRNDWRLVPRKKHFSSHNCSRLGSSLPPHPPVLHDSATNAGVHERATGMVGRNRSSKDFELCRLGTAFPQVHLDTRADATHLQVYITSSDHGDAHDIFMVAYIVLNLPYMILHTSLSPTDSSSKSLRRGLAFAFFATLAPLVYFYLQHKVHRVAGGTLLQDRSGVLSRKELTLSIIAYSVYALFEWLLIILDVSFDSIFINDYEEVYNNAPFTPVSLELHSSESTATTVSPARSPSAFELRLRRIAISTIATRSFLANVYLSYLFWTLLTALGPMIFYASVWAMGLSGDEVLLFSILSPALLVIPQIQEIFSRPVFGNVGLLIGVAARWIPDEADGARSHGSRRLRMVSMGLALSTLGKIASWWKVREDQAKLRARSTTFLLGLVVSLLTKYANHSLNPLWPFTRSTLDEKTTNGGWNGLGLAVGVLAYLQTSYSTGASGRNSDRQESQVRTLPRSLRPAFGSGVASTLGFGGLFFLIVLLFTDSGTTIAWSFEGYPTSGPFNVPHGSLTILSISFGIILQFLSPSITNRLTTSIPAFAMACICASLMYTQTGWNSFLPALYLATHSTVLFPHYLTSLLKNTSTPSSFFLAFLAYCLLVLASTFATAYAFVPGGLAFRERMDLVLGVALILVGFGLYPLRFSRFIPSSMSSTATTSRTLRRHVSFSFLAIVFVSLAVSAWRYHVLWGSAASPHHPENRVISAAIWTVHFGLDGKMWESQRRMAQIIRDAEIDVVGM